MEYIFLIVIVIGVCIYLTDRKGWNATARRLSNIVRANIESAKPIKQIEKKIEQHEIDSWTAEFEGRPVDEGPKHVIIKTWFSELSGVGLRPYYKCKCGYSDWHTDIEYATIKSREHVREQNKADELLKKNGGTKAW
jgi:hypothetical protein